MRAVEVFEPGQLAQYCHHDKHTEYRLHSLKLTFVGNSSGTMNASTPGGSGQAFPSDRACSV